MDDPNFLRCPILTDEEFSELDPEYRDLYRALMALWGIGTPPPPVFEDNYGGTVTASWPQPEGKNDRDA